VDDLAHQVFPVEHPSILARDLRLVQRVRGRGRLRHAAFVVAASGEWFARCSLLGRDLHIISPWALGAVLWDVLSGTFGACWGLVAPRSQRQQWSP
jgi:hypothetical protein